MAHRLAPAAEEVVGIIDLRASLEIEPDVIPVEADDVEPALSPTIMATGGSLKAPLSYLGDLHGDESAQRDGRVLERRGRPFKVVPAGRNGHFLAAGVLGEWADLYGCAPL
jgi:hypothetical protein